MTKETTGSRPAVVDPWRQTVLVPRGIEIVDEPSDELALEHFCHFGADEDQCREWILRRVESEDDDTVFLRGGDDFNTDVARQYMEMTDRNLCEEEFAAFAKTMLLTTSEFLPAAPKKTAWKAQRMIQLYTQPDTTAFVLGPTTITPWRGIFR